MVNYMDGTDERIVQHNERILMNAAAAAPIPSAAQPKQCPMPIPTSLQYFVLRRPCGTGPIQAILNGGSVQKSLLTEKWVLDMSIRTGSMPDEMVASTDETSAEASIHPQSTPQQSQNDERTFMVTASTSSSSSSMSSLHSSTTAEATTEPLQLKRLRIVNDSIATDHVSAVQPIPAAIYSSPEVCDKDNGSNTETLTVGFGNMECKSAAVLPVDTLDIPMINSHRTEPIIQQTSATQATAGQVNVPGSDQIEMQQSSQKSNAHDDMVNVSRSVDTNTLPRVTRIIINNDALVGVPNVKNAEAPIAEMASTNIQQDCLRNDEIDEDILVLDGNCSDDDAISIYAPSIRYG